jgi:RND family efflux transporter MFP subunit
MQKRYLGLCLVAGSLLLAACGSKPQAADNSHYVKVFVVGGNVEQTQSTFHGVIHAEYEPNLSFRVGGKIIQRNVDIGQTVTQGQVLASLDPTDYKLSADSANAQLASAKSNYVTQKANLERYKQLLQQNFVSQAQYDTQKAQFDSAKAQYEQAQNQLSNNDNQVKYTTLKAPSAGIITSITMDAGQVVTSGQTVATMAVSGNKEVEIELPEVQINNYKAGMPAQVKIWATDQVYKGTIRIINQASDQQTRTFTARIVIINPDANIKYGMAADVKIAPLNVKDGTELPLSSLYSNDGKTSVWIINDTLFQPMALR